MSLVVKIAGWLREKPSKELNLFWVLLFAVTALATLQNPANVYAYSDALMVYNRNNPQSQDREYDHGNQSFATSSENAAPYVVNSEWIPRVVQIYTIPVNSTRWSTVGDEKIMVTLADNGGAGTDVLFANVWDDTNKVWGPSQQLANSANMSAEVNYLPFDGAYETTTGNFMLVYSNGGNTNNNNGSQIDYAYYNGGWTTTSHAFNGTDPGTSGRRVRWVKAAASPVGNNIGVVVGDDAGTPLAAANWWNGTGWAANWTALTNSSFWSAGTAVNQFGNTGNGRGFSIACVNNATGRCYIFLGFNTNQNFGGNSVNIYAAYNDSPTWTASAQTATNVDTAGTNNTIDWLQAAADPSAPDSVLVAMEDSGSRLAIQSWQGGIWISTASANAASTTAMQNRTNGAFTVMFESSTNKAIIPYFTSGAPVTQIKAKAWTAVGAVVALANGPTFGASNGETVRAFYDAGNTSDVMVAATNNKGELSYTRWTEAAGGKWVPNATALPIAGYLNMVGGNERGNFAMSREALAYGRKDSAIPYRQNTKGSFQWDLTDNAQSAAGTDTGGAPRYVRVVASPFEGKKLMGFQTNLGAIGTQEWNNTSKTWSSSETITSAPLDITTNKEQFRAFDIAYGRSNGNAMIVYSDGSQQPAYQTRTQGTAQWSGNPANSVTAFPANGIIEWVRAEANPVATSSEVVVVAMDAGAKIGAAVWNGTSWGNGISLTGAGTANALNTQQPFDVAYIWNDNNPHALVAFGDSTAPNLWSYIVWYSTGQNWGAKQPGYALNGSAPRWIRLATNKGTLTPNTTDFIGMAFEDSASNLGAGMWSGFKQAWQNTNNAIIATAQAAFQMRTFDIAWLRDGSEFDIAFDNNNSALLNHIAFNGATWDSVRTDATATNGVYAVNMLAEPNDGTGSNNELYINVVTNVRQLKTYHTTAGLYGNTIAAGNLFTPSSPLLYSGFEGEATNPNYEPMFAAYTLDFTPPTSTISFPKNGGQYASSLTSISGTATDGAGSNVAGVSKTQILLQDLFYGTSYYSVAASTWVTVATWNDNSSFAGGNPASWSLTFSSGIFTSNHQYTFQARAVDYNKNIQTSPTSVSVYFDTTTPQGGITYPVQVSGNNGYYQSAALTTLSGTAMDPGNPAPPATFNSVNNGKLFVNLKHQTPQGDISYFNPASGWGSINPVNIGTFTFTQNGLNNGGIWTSTFMPTNLADGATYFLGLEVQDQAGNWTTSGTTVTFVVDNSTPSANVTFPATEGGNYRSFPSIVGVTFDSFTVVTTSLTFFNGNNFFNNTGPDGFGSFASSYTNTSNTRNWSYAAPWNWTNVENEVIQIFARGQDAAGNIGSGSQDHTVRTFVVTNSSPTAAITFPVTQTWYNNSNNALTTLTGTATHPDNNATLLGALIYIKRLSDNAYYNCSGGFGSPNVVISCNAQDQRTSPTSHPTDFRTDGNASSINWQYTSPDWGVSGSSYALVIDARDTARDVNDVMQSNQLDWTTLSKTTFYYDITAPTSSITSPSVNGTVGTNPTFSGTYFDGNSGVTKVQYLLWDVTANQYWDPTGPTWRTEAKPALSSWPSANLWASSWTVVMPNNSMPSPPTINTGDKFLMVTAAQDLAGNTQTDFTTTSSSFNFYLDTQPVTFSNLSPSIAANSSNVSPITGLYQFPGSFPAAPTLTRLDIRISSAVDGAHAPAQWWTGSSWTTTSNNWSTATIVDASHFSYTISTSAFTDGTFYRITMRGTDSNGNVTVISADETNVYDGFFVFDITPPTSSITPPPANNGFYPSLTTLTVAATDKSPGSGVSLVQVAIQDLNNSNKWWNGTNAWITSASPVWLNTSPSGPNWIYSVIGINFNSLTGHKLSLTSRAQDVATNQEGNGTGNTPITFVIDQTPPTSYINNLVPNSIISTYTVVTGTATDLDAFGNTRMNGVRLNIYDQTSGEVWTGPGTQWQTGTLSWVIANYSDYSAGASSGTWTYPFPDLSSRNGHVININSQAFDQALNYETNYSTVSFTIDFYVNSPQTPDSLVTTPANSLYTNVPINTIVGTAFDRVSVTEVRVKLMRLNGGTTQYWDGIGGSWTGSLPAPLPPATLWPSSWTYNSSNAAIWAIPNLVLSVTSIAKDPAQNVQLVLATNTFTYDTQAPVSTITYPSNSGYIAQSAQVQGVSADNFLTSKVFVRISTNSLGSFYTGSSWTTTSNTWLQATLSPNATAWWVPTSSNAWVTNVNFTAESYAVDAANNSQLTYSTVTFIADFLAPVSTITYPNFATSNQALTQVSGTVFHAPPGVVGSIQLSYFAKTGANANNYWNPATGQFNSSSVVYATATLSPGATSWWATGTNLPNFPTTAGGVTYDVFSQSINGAGVAEAKPGTTTTPPTQSNYIEFQLTTPVPITTITSPVGNPAYFQPTTVILQGGYAFSTTAQIQILDCGANTSCNAGNESKFWNGSTFVSTTGWANNGFVGVTTFGGGIWSVNVATSAWFNGTHLYQITSQGLNPGQGLTENPGQLATFVVDNNLPNISVSMPAGTAYYNSMPTLQGTASDTSPGVLNSVIFRVFLGTTAWNWQQSSFGNVSPPATDLPAILNGGLYSYTTDYFLATTGTGTWQNGKTYSVHLIATDAAGNQTDIPQHRLPLIRWHRRRPWCRRRDGDPEPPHRSRNHQ